MNAQAALSVLKRGEPVRLHKRDGLLDTRGLLDRADEVASVSDTTYNARWYLTINEADGEGLQTGDLVGARNRTMKVRSVSYDDVFATAVLESG